MKYRIQNLGELDIDKEKDLELFDQCGGDTTYTVTGKHILQRISDTIKNAISIGGATFVQEYDGEQHIMAFVDVDRKVGCLSKVEHYARFDVLWPNPGSKTARKLTLSEFENFIQDGEDMEYILCDTQPVRPFAFNLRFDKMKVSCFAEEDDVRLESASGNARFNGINFVIVDDVDELSPFEMSIKLIGEYGQEYHILARSKKAGVRTN